MTVLIVIFGEVAPKTAAIARPDQFAMFVAPLMRWVVIFFSPVTAVLRLMVRGAL